MAVNVFYVNQVSDKIILHQEITFLYVVIVIYKVRNAPLVGCTVVQHNQWSSW